ncbi:MAG: ABC transporter substrate-binding protein, partial [Alphaproteobacteria bacterium]
RSDGGPPIAADWRVRRMPDGELKIIDLRVEGISLAETKRQEFASMIANNGFAGFLDQLRGQSDGAAQAASVPPQAARQ